MQETLIDKNLIRQYVDEGDERSLEILVEKYLKPIYSFVYKNVGNHADAEDITQEIFLKVWKNMDKFDQTKSFKPWVFQIAKNASIDFLRKKKAIPFSKFENEKGQNALIENIVSAPLNILENLSDKKVLSVALQCLNEKEQKLINFRHYEDLNFREIANRFEEPVNTIKSRYRRALENLRKNIRKD